MESFKNLRQGQLIDSLESHKLKTLDYSSVNIIYVWHQAFIDYSMSLSVAAISRRFLH